MAIKTRKQLGDEIESLCEQAGCNEKIQKIHHAQYVDRRWNPHPPRAFLSWWNQDGPKLTVEQTGRAWEDIDAVRAWNCEAVRQVYRPPVTYNPQTDDIDYGEDLHEKGLAWQN